jgi:hypothetical protein
MPTIPSLERRTVTPSSRVTNVGVADIGSVGRELGGAIDRTRARVDEAAQKKTRYELADANSKLNILAYQQNNAYDRDDDYETIPDRWDESWSKGIDELASKISDPEARNAFMMQAAEQKEANRARITQLAFGKERDVKRSEMNTQYNALRDIVITGDAKQAADAINSMGELAQAGVDNDYYDHEEGGRLTQTWRQDAAIGRIEAIPPSDRVKALEDPLVLANIPADKLAMLRRTADDEVLDEQAMAAVDGLGSEFSLSRLYDVSSQIDDPNLRRKVEARGETQFKQRRNAKMEQAEEFHQNEFVPVLLGEKELDTSSPEFRKLPVNYQTSLIKATEAKDSPAKRTDPWVQDKMMELYTKQNFTELREFYISNIGKMSGADQSKWSKVSWDGVVPDDWKSKFTDVQRIVAEIKGAGITDVNAKDTIVKIVNNWHEEQIESGIKVTDKDIQAKIKESIATVELDPTAYFNKEEKKYYTLTPEEREEMVGTTLKSYDKVNDDQLNIVVRDVLENRNDMKEMMNTVQIGLSNPDRLSKSNQDALAEKLVEFDPDLSTQIYNAASSTMKRTPTAAEFLRMYERARKSR